MQPFRHHTSLAAVLLRDNIDTDAIIPARFLKTTERAGLAKGLFADLRHDADGTANDFVLNHPPFDKAEILIAGANFGCGSSREHAPWALLDFGIRCVIAPSFADIFRNNCFANGILPIAVEDKETLRNLCAVATRGEEVSISLEDQEVRFGNQSFAFAIEAGRKSALLEGRDAIATTCLREAEIAAFEATRATAQPWL